jgi:hypothetical protein
MFSVGSNSAFDQSMEKALYNIKLNTLLLLLLNQFVNQPFQVYLINKFIQQIMNKKFEKNAHHST